jgi:hypothetical protein
LVVCIHFCAAARAFKCAVRRLNLGDDEFPTCFRCVRFPCDFSLVVTLAGSDRVRGHDAAVAFCSWAEFLLLRVLTTLRILHDIPVLFTV